VVYVPLAATRHKSCEPETLMEAASTNNALLPLDALDAI